VAAGIWGVSIDKIVCGRAFKGFTPIRDVKTPLLLVHDALNLGHLVDDLCDVSRPETVRLSSRRNVELSAAVKSHDSVEARSIKEQGEEGCQNQKSYRDVLLHADMYLIVIVSIGNSSFQTSWCFGRAFPVPVPR
jgi:hypothetical protein